MRFWILGNWIANKIELDFEFYGLVLQSKEPDLKAEFGKYIIRTSKSEFFRLTWEEISILLCNPKKRLIKKE